MSCQLIHSLTDPKLMMKWPYRFTAAIIFTTTVVILYTFWGSDTSIWTGKTTSSVRETLDKTTPRLIPKTIGGGTPEWRNFSSRQLPNEHIIELTGEHCQFANTNRAKTNISTFKILELINEGMDGPPDLSDGASPLKLKDVKYDKLEYEMPEHIKQKPLTVIVVPHSHSDPGWLKTIGAYFNDQTHPTFDNMVAKLMKFPNMTFVWAESVFLSMWYKDLDAESKADVQKLIHRGQLEIVAGSWVVPDEANPHYFALVDQMIEGHQWLKENLGVKPTNTWSLDPFGYSSTLPYLYKRAGYQNMVILRTHELVKNNLIDQYSLEFFWQQPWDRDGRSAIFTQMMPYKLYNIKHTCGPDHNVCLQFDFRKIPGEWSEAHAEYITDSNVERQAKLLLGQYHKKAALFQTQCSASTIRR